MSEYMERHTVSRLMARARLRRLHRRLLTDAIDAPAFVLLLDEIEKGPPDSSTSLR